MTGSANVLTLLNRYGHCSSYSFVLECETALCNSSVIRDEIYFPKGIVKGHEDVVTHFCWDNWDQLEETVSGAGTTHSTHDIIIQDYVEDSSPATEIIPQPHTKSKSVDIVPKPNPVYYAKEKVEPTLTVSLIETTKLQSSKASARSDTLWIVCRFQCQHEPQTLPGWSGWVSQTSDLC